MNNDQFEKDNALEEDERRPGAAPQQSSHQEARWAAGEESKNDEVEYRFNLDDHRPSPDGKKRPANPTFLLGAGMISLLVLAALALVIGGAVNRLLKESKSAAGSPSYIIGGNSLVITDLPQDSGDTQELADGGYTSTEIVKKVLPSVVGISTYDEGSVTPVSTASGIIMTRDGYIVTNGHVVSGASGVNVTLYDGSQYKASIEGIDDRTDLAVIKIEADNLVAATFGDSDSVQVGERVLAIGNPGGLAGSTTQGIISGVNRQLTFSSTMEPMNLLQTDAAINPGNSGGALVNRFAQVIGISSAKISRVDYEGVGFAIPVAEAKPILDNLMQYGYVRDRAVLGISVVALNEAVGDLNNLPKQGLYITQMESYSPLQKQNIKEGDVLLKIDDKELTTIADLLGELKKHKPGDSVTLTVYKQEGGRTVKAICELVQAGGTSTSEGGQ